MNKTYPVKFDIKNPAHLDTYNFYLHNRKWPQNAPRFHLEDGYVSVPHMIDNKLAREYLNGRNSHE